MSNKSSWIRDTLTRAIRVLIFAAIAGVMYLGAQSFYDFELGFMEDSNAPAPVQVAEVTVTTLPEPAKVLPLVVQPVYKDQELSLSGVPAYGRMRFMLPVDANVSEARAKLGLRSEVPDSVYATLRISINGARRLETVLPNGVKETSIRIDLKPEDLVRNTLEISYAVVGNSTINICSVDQPASVVRFMPASHLEISARTTELTLMDRFRQAGGMLNISWNEKDDNATSAARLLVAAKAMKLDVPVAFTSPEMSGFTIDEAEKILHEVGQLPQNVVQPSWPLHFISDTSDGGARIFTGRTSWRYQYSVKTLPDDRLPAKFHYAMRLGPMLDNEGHSREWMLWFRFNGRLLETRTAREGVVEGSIDLSNVSPINDGVIEISVGRPFGVDGVCNAGPPYIAELLPTTRLEPGEELKRAQSRFLVSALDKKPLLALEKLDTLTPSMAFAAAGLLADLPVMPEIANEGVVGTSLVQIVRPSDLTTAAPMSQVYYQEAKQSRFDRLMIANTRESFHNNIVVLLVSDEISLGVGEKKQE